MVVEVGQIVPPARGELTWVPTSSTIVQFLSHIAAEMPHSINEDWCPPVHRGTVPRERGHDALFRYLEAVPEQGPLLATDGVFDPEGIGQYCGRCDHVDEYYHEGHGSGQ